MSDPVTNVQIEDVLSSIRKLVSEEVRAQTRPRAVEAMPKTPEGSDKLILTPALRVPSEKSDDEVAAVDEEYGGAEAEEEMSFDIDAFSRGLVDGTAEADDKAETAAEDHDDLVGLSEDEAETTEDAPLDLGRFARPVQDAAPEEDADEAEEEAAPQQMIPSFLRSRGRTLDDRIVEVPPVEEEETDDALTWQDAGDTDIDGDIWAEAGTDEAEEADDASLLDEEMLRDMVAEIVRQELQGALGERITRNVRKLVRREIQRALTAHDLL